MIMFDVVTLTVYMCVYESPMSRKPPMTMRNNVILFANGTVATNARTQCQPCGMVTACMFNGSVAA